MISLVGDYKVAEATIGQTVTFDKDDAAVTGIQADDVVMVQAMFRAQTGGGIAATTTGGQTWNEVHDAQDNLDNALYTCVFDGTWTADPVFTSDNGSDVPRCIWVWVLRGVDTTDIFDVAPVWATDTDASYQLSTWNTNTDNAWAFAMAGGADDTTWTVNNSFLAPSGSGNIYVNTSAGADACLVACRKEIATAGAVGATTMTSSLGVTGFKVFGALKAAVEAPEEAPEKLWQVASPYRW